MNNTKKQYLGLIPVLLSVLLVGFWIGKRIFDTNETTFELFSDSYWIVPMIGGALGIYNATHWGGLKSVFGRALLFMSGGLLLESIGLLLYTLIYRFTGEELPYPSLGDAIFLLGIVSYIIGTWNLLRVFTPIKRMILRPIWQVLVTVALMLVTLGVVWIGFLGVGITDERGFVVRLLNTSYPVLQLVFLSFTLLALLKIRSTKGGKMAGAVGSMLVALGVLYVADYVFLYQSYKETWQAGGTSDLVYVLAYGSLSASLYLINRSRTKLLTQKAE